MTQNESSKPTGAAPEAGDLARKMVDAQLKRRGRARRAYLLLGGLAVAVLAVYFIHGYITRNQVSTDDAQVEADVVPIAARVAGPIAHMKVEDNQAVKVGDVIAEIEPADYDARVAAAKAELTAALAQAEAADAQIDIVSSTSAGGLSSAQAQVQGSAASVRAAAAQIDAAAAGLARARVELAKAESDYQRTEKMHAQRAATDHDLELAATARDAARTAVDAAAANVAGARNQLRLSESRVAEARARVEQSTPVDRQVAAATAAAKVAHARADSARAALELASLQRTYTTVRAPASGTVSRLAAHDGQVVQAGTTLCMLVPDETYVIANFKETQVARIAPGDPVEVTVDALDRTIDGRVVSVAAGTGARFSLMPPDNATGNFVKVVQRVPVKIVWEDGEDLTGLRAGLSAEVEIHLQH